jgi:hypothetical protein
LSHEAYEVQVGVDALRLFQKLLGAAPVPLFDKDRGKKGA